MILPGLPVGIKGTPLGYQKFTHTGSTQTFTVPSQVYSVCVLVVGSGGGLSNVAASGGASGGGGACAYSNNISVIPGQEYQADGAFGSTLVYAEPGSDPTPTASPGFYNVGIGGLASNSVGDVKYDGQDGIGGGTNTGGSAGGPAGTIANPGTAGYGVGINAGENSWSSGRGEAGAGGYIDGANGIPGIPGFTLVIWGHARFFSSSSNY